MHVIRDPEGVDWVIGESGSGAPSFAADAKLTPRVLTATAPHRAVSFQVPTDWRRYADDELLASVCAAVAFGDEP